MKYLKLAPVLLAVSVGAWAQSDPKITSSVVPELNPNEVTLSRGITTPVPKLTGQAAYRVKITMNASNELNGALFTAKTSVVKAAPDNTVVAGAIAKFETEVVPNATLHVSGEDPNCTIDINDPTSLSCNFGDGQLLTGNTAEFIILVQSPESGGRIKLDWSFGGDEGKGGGNGCCTKLGSVDTKLVDAAAANSTVKTHLQTFVVKNPNVPTTLFTGVNKGATLDDPWVTIADLGISFIVAGGTKTYVQGLIDEKKNLDAGISSCSPSNKNECWRSQLMLADTKFPSTDPLWITVERHSSIIKNGTKLDNYTLGFVYAKEEAGPFVDIPLCADVGGLSETIKHCLAPRGTNLTACVERPDPTKASAFVWSCTIKALENGFIARR
jgi:hypothetical protein